MPCQGGEALRSCGACRPSERVPLRQESEQEQGNTVPARQGGVGEHELPVRPHAFGLRPPLAPASHLDDECLPSQTGEAVLTD